MAVRGGSVRDRIYDGVQGYIVCIAVIAVLFGGTLAVSFGHVVMQGIFTGIGSLVREVPAGADTMQKIQNQPVATAPDPTTAAPERRR